MAKLELLYFFKSMFKFCHTEVIFFSVGGGGGITVYWLFHCTPTCEGLCVFGCYVDICSNRGTETQPLGLSSDKVLLQTLKNYFNKGLYLKKGTKLKKELTPHLSWGERECFGELWSCLLECERVRFTDGA
ncbi:UNVERIFIED_CONTAM: hypothetical protein K2H54_074771 [Gekko kuhli]